MLHKRIEKSSAILLDQSWLPYALLILITGLAAGFRFFKLGEWSFWIDEIYTINHALSHFSSPDLILAHIPPFRNWVPISVILAGQTLTAWGVNEWSARFPSAMIGILTIPVLYFPAKKMFGTRIALIAMLLLAVSPWHIFWSQNARFYTSMMLFYSLALFAFFFGIEQDRPRYFVVFYLLFYLALSERMISILLIPVIVAYLLMLWLFPFEKPPGYRARNILILSAPIIAFLVLQVFLLATTGTFTFASDVDALAAPIDSPIRLLIIMAFQIGVPILSLAVFTGIYLLLKRERSGLFFFIGAVLPPILIALVNPFVFVVERYAFVALSFWILLAAIGLSTLFSMVDKHRIVLTFGIFFILLADAAGDNLMYYQINHGDRLDWREAIGYVQERKRDGDVVVSTRAPLARYYLGEEVLEYKDMHPEDFEKIRSSIWFVMDYPGVWHGKQDSKDWMESHANLLQYSFLRTREENSLLIYRFDPTQQADR